MGSFGGSYAAVRRRGAPRFYVLGVQLGAPRFYVMGVQLGGAPRFYVLGVQHGGAPRFYVLGVQSGAPRFYVMGGGWRCPTFYVLGWRAEDGVEAYVMGEQRGGGGMQRVGVFEVKVGMVGKQWVLSDGVLAVGSSGGGCGHRAGVATKGSADLRADLSVSFLRQASVGTFLESCSSVRPCCKKKKGA